MEWETYGEYLESIDRMDKGVNVGGMVGHCAVRIHAMGERSLDEAPATDDDVARMCELVDEAIGAGALGFSTSRTFLHKVPDGRYVPGTHADPSELLAIGRVLGRRGKGVFEGALRIGERDREENDRCQNRKARERRQMVGKPQSVPPTIDSSIERTTETRCRMAASAHQITSCQSNSPRIARRTAATSALCRRRLTTENAGSSPSFRGRVTEHTHPNVVRLAEAR